MTAPRLSAVEVQDDLFGLPVVHGDPQGSLFTDARQGLQDAERTARATLARLKPSIDARTATDSDVEAYREALALLNRAEALGAEEIAIRARQSHT